MATKIKNANASTCGGVILKFAEHLGKVDGELNQVIEHLQTVEQELGGEAREIEAFRKEDLNPLLNGNPSQEDIANIINDEESIGRSIEKINSDLSKEIEELRDFLSALESVKEESERAEMALKRLEEIENDKLKMA